MKRPYVRVLLILGTAFGASTCCAQTLQTHRIPAALAAEAESEVVESCARQGYRETAVLLDADGAPRCEATAPVFIPSIARTTWLTPVPRSRTTRWRWPS
jgi:hypothetical protein